ncbi:MAG: hypothetical protein KDK40_04590, partial [Chlamydiia bacterium]|nr:hypothetical protein [Chlamydiia bacterium]
INLPGLRNRFLLSEYPKLVKGLYRIRDKRLYINRGLGSLFPFRLFSPPEITLFTFSKNQPETPSRNFYN